jgi:hypothetical protein
MKDQNKVQVTNDKLQHEATFTGDQLQNAVTATESFKNSGTTKTTLLSGLQKKINPRLFIL